MAEWLLRAWFQRRLVPALWFLWPLQGVFVLLSGLRRRRIRAQPLSVPVVVVGNLVVGGAGKTPLTLGLAKALQQRGWRPGIISRGYGRQTTSELPEAVTAHSTAKTVGDEPLLMQRRLGIPVWVGRDRAAAGRALLDAHPEVDVVLCDDGLQHYALARDVELAVVDARGLGNGYCLPMGPLRESAARLSTVDAVIGNEINPSELVPWAVSPKLPFYRMNLVPGPFYALDTPERRCSAESLQGKSLHAIAGMGHPSRFFRTLDALGLSVTPHPFPDHHAYRAEDLDFGPGAVLLMTEKDAVKCAGLVAGEAWVLPVDAELPSSLVDLIVEKIRGRPFA